MKRVSLKHVAQVAGVSVATVSMALRGAGRIAPKTVERIEALANEMGYVPDPLLASLATRRFREDSDSKGSPSAVIKCSESMGRGDYAERFRDSLSSLGYVMESHRLDSPENFESLVAKMTRRGIRGVILIPDVFPEILIDPSPWSKFSIVQSSRFLHSAPVHTVRANIFQAVKLAYTKAYEAGYRRIGFALGFHEYWIEDDESRNGAAWILQQHFGRAENYIPPYQGYLSGGDRSFLDWYHHYRPEAVVAFNSNALARLQALGIHAPNDLGFIALHLNENEIGAPSSEVRICGLDQNNKEVARQTVWVLDQMIRFGETGFPEVARDILIPSTWVAGDTLRKQ